MYKSMKMLKGLLIVAVLFSANIVQGQIPKKTQIADSLYKQGVFLYRQSKFDEALNAFLLCDSIESVVRPQDSVYRKMWIAACYYHNGDTISASRTSKYYYAPVDRRLTIESDSISAIADDYIRIGDYDKALYHLNRVASLEKKNLGETSPWYCNTQLSILDIQMYDLLYNSKVSLESINITLNNMKGCFATYQQYYTSDLPILIQIIQPLRDLFNTYYSSSNINNEEPFLFDSFYQNLVEICKTHNNTHFLDPNDGIYGRIVEEYYSLLLKSGNKRTASEMISHVESGIQNHFNANAVIIEICKTKDSYFNEDIDVAKASLNHIFNIIQDNIAYNNTEERVWLEDRVINNKRLFIWLNQDSLLYSIISNCINEPSFRVSENVKFAQSSADFLAQYGKTDDAGTLFQAINSEVDLKRDPDDYQSLWEMARYEANKGEYTKALEIYKQIEKYGDIAVLDKHILYYDIANCFAGIGNSNEYDRYISLYVQQLNYVFKEFFSDTNIANKMNSSELTMYNENKKMILRELKDYYYKAEKQDSLLNILLYTANFSLSNKDYRNYISTLIDLGSTYMFKDAVDFNKSFFYFNKAIDLCDSLQDEAELKNQLLATAYSMMANLYSMSAEPELSISQIKKAIYYNKQTMYDIKKDQNLLWSTKAQLINVVLDAFQNNVGNLCETNNDLSIFNDYYCYKSILNIMNDFGVFINKKDIFNLTNAALQSDIFNDYICGGKDSISHYLGELSKLYHDYPDCISINDLFWLGEYHLFVGDSIQAKAYFDAITTNNGNHYKKSSYDYDYYYESLRKSSEIGHSHRWITELHELTMEVLKGKNDPDHIKKLLSIAKIWKNTDDTTATVHLSAIYDEILDNTDSLEGDDNCNIYSDILSFCIENKKYDILRNNYEKFSECGIKETKKELLSWQETAYSTYSENGLGEMLKNIYPTQEINVGQIYNGLLFRKNAVLTVSIAFSNLIKESEDSLLHAKYDRTVRLKDLVKKSNGNIVYNSHTVSTEEALKLIDRFENEIRFRSFYFGDYATSLNYEWRDVQSVLKSNEIAIEFSQFSDSSGNTQYAAVVLKSKGEPVYIYIGDSAKLQELKNPSNEFLEKTYSIIWAQIIPYLKKIDKIYFSLDGALHNIPIEMALHDGQYMMEKYKLYRLSTTRLLVNNKPSKSKKNNIVLYGGLNYNSDIANHSFAQKRNMPTFQSFDSLPHTLSEVKEIKTICDFNNLKTELYTGNKGTEASFDNLSNKEIDVLHIATHGFYLKEIDSMSFVSLKREDSLITSREELALVRSGLVMSNANSYCNNYPSQDDGILSAREISKLDLHRVDLVVLSACKSGLGDLTTDGVLGLQRGFKKAGVNSMIMSLWSVDDFASKMLMTQFYHNFIDKKMSKRESLLQAQKYVKNFEIDEDEWISILRKQREGNTHYYGKKEAKNKNKKIIKPFQDPIFWAAFILLDGID